MTYCIWYVLPKNPTFQQGYLSPLLQEFGFFLLTFFLFCGQVFSFLDHINLCRAAIVCRQWRVASAHEDFWRSLNFENRNISVEQCECNLI